MYINIVLMEYFIGDSIMVFFHKFKGTIILDKIMVPLNVNQPEFPHLLCSG